MRTVGKLLLGVLTVWPVVYVFGFMMSMFSMVIAGLGNPGPGGARTGVPPSIVALFAVHFVTIVGTFALMTFYVVNVFRNDRVDKDRKVLWAVVLLMGGMIAMPIYWYLYIWSGEKAAAFEAGPQALESRPGQATKSDYRSSPEQPYVPPSEPPDWR